MKKLFSRGMVVCAWIVLGSGLWACAASPLPDASSDPDIATLMGETKARQALADRIAKSGHTWEEYAAWGKALVTKGFVENPPTGTAPSPKLSNAFVCTDCHNLEREDPVLSVQDPEARLQYIQPDPNLFLTQGTTFWGMANRVAFYNGYYAQYHDLCVPETTGDINVPNGGPDKNGNCMTGTRKMNPASLEDALQVCSAYCSEGRYLLRWEMDAILAYLWDNQVHLSDLDLSAAQRASVRNTLLAPSAEKSQVEVMREFLATKYLRRAGDTYRDMPTLRENADGTFTVGAYQNGETFVGDAQRGKLVYERACLHCHGTPLMPLDGASLIGNVPLFYQALAKGIPNQDSPYMPEYTLQRMSHQQSADVQAYLESLGN